MSNDAIMVPGQDDYLENNQEETLNQEYLTVDGSLKEIAENGTTDVARNYLNVYSKKETYSKLEVDDITDGIQTQLNEHTEQATTIINGVRESLDNIQQNLNSFVIKDGEISFDKTPKVRNEYLVTVSNLLKRLETYSTNKNVEETYQDIIEILESYALISEVYKKSDLYTKSQIDKTLYDYVTFKDLTEKNINAKCPKTRTNISTKGYVDDVMKSHRNELDPHNFLSTLTTKLSNYYKKSEVFTKAQTYSRAQLDEIIDNLVSNACKSLIEDHISNTPHLTTAEVRQIVKLYAQSNLVSQSDIDAIKSDIDDKIDNVKPIWKTSGPVLTTVGFVEDNTELPSEMTMQEILDAIFYGSKISINVDPTVSLGNSTEVTICIHSGIQVESIELLQNGKVIPIDDSNFEEGCQTIPTDALMEDTEFKFKVTFVNGLEQEETAKVKVVAPSFVGLLPKWRFGTYITMKYLEELAASDPKNNRFILEQPKSVSQTYQFKDSELKHPFIVVPADGNNLVELVTKSQNFSSDAFDAFDVINMMPLQIENKSIIYKVYVYRQALSSLNQTLTFNFE